MDYRSKVYLRSNRNSESFRIRVGSQFQADIPAICSVKYDVCDSSVGELQWDPGALPETEVADYLKSVKLAGKLCVDQETALRLLHQCEYNTEKALELLPQIQDLHVTWSEDECRRFEDGLEMYGKDFYLVQKFVHTKTLDDIVKLYYTWKKTERYDVFVNQRPFFGRSRFRTKVKRKIYRSIEYGDVFLEEEGA
ncbi:mesoderm induction early response protein 1-like [Stegodyphus dumicola]|uniref:mesoderm induction early response protein 1-like n=1 Tax=Stegodyphus dumicola TaxID=202533 RepID=UPI0015AE9014|nr:mesoderm induction early response protein 1-like [Stegodyphus dumicola]